VLGNATNIKYPILKFSSLLYNTFKVASQTHDACFLQADARSYHQTISKQLLRRGRVDIYKIPSKVQLDGHKVSTLSFLF